jgi:hypothetical protein
MKYTEKKMVFIAYKLAHNVRIFQKQPERKGGVNSSARPYGITQ